jgi:tetratricopeptide (TPR) repeat protein
MADAANRRPKVFISFAHESDESDARIQSLAGRLRALGIDAVSYLTELFPEEGWTLWMERQLEEADFVLMVCTESYRRRAEGKEKAGAGGGVKWESMLIRNALHQAGTVNSKFIPVVFDAADRKYVPQRFYDFTVFTLADFDLSDAGFRGLYRVITRQAPGKGALGDLVVLDAVGPSAPAPALIARPWNVPPRTPYFTGRKDVLERLRSTLVERGRAALSGLGGLGKTQCAIEYAYRYRGDYSAVFWARASTPATLAADFRALAKLVGIDAGGQDEQAMVEAVRRWLAEHTGWLLVLDNADKPQAVKPFLPAADAGHVLLTSRAQLFDVIGIVKPEELTELSPEEARGFLFARAGRAEPPGGGAEATAASELAEEVGRLPLALEQAGAYIASRQARFQDFRDSYRNWRVKLLDKQGPVVGDYPESVRTTWAMNFRDAEDESAAAADVLRLSAFLAPDDIPIELLVDGASVLGPALSSALAGAAGDPLAVDEALAPLTRFSLVRRDIGARTYSIHRLVQAVLRSDMEAPAQRLWADRAIGAVSQAFPPTAYGSWDRCERLIAHARACAGLIDEWGVSSQPATTLLYRMGAYVRERGRPDEAMRLSERASHMGEATEHPHVAISLTSLAAAQRDKREYREAEATLQRALAIARSAPDPDQSVVATCLNNLGDVYRLQGEYDKAEPLLRRALELRLSLHGEENRATSRSIHDLGLLLFDQGLLAEAEPLLERAVRIRETILDVHDPEVARAHDSLARLYTSQGRHAAADALFVRFLPVAEQVLGLQHPRLALMYENYAELLHRMGRDGDAKAAEARAAVIRGAAPA